MEKDQQAEQQLNPLISEIRFSSRELVRNFGLMNKSVAGTGLSLSAVHAIMEIGKDNTITSKRLGDLLHLEKSTISRLVQSLVKKNQIFEQRSQSDGRKKQLYLTKQGKKTLVAIDRHADTQVSEAITGIDQNSQKIILQGLRDYSSALKQSNSTKTPPHAAKLDAKSFSIAHGYTPMIIGSIVKMFLEVMSDQYGFGASFESRISSDLAEFVSRLNSPENEMWHGHMNGQLVGSISIDGENLGNNNAHLRWFVVDKYSRGSGMGEALLLKALAYCDESGFQQTQLWTVKGLDTARRLYEKHGFILDEEYSGDQWGKRVIEQKFIRRKSTVRSIGS